MHLKKSCYPIINYFKAYIDLKVDNKVIAAIRESGETRAYYFKLSTC